MTADRIPTRSDRPACAPGPGPDTGQLRAAYLGLLKLALCDLAGASTSTVEGLPDGGAASRELSGDERDLRVLGTDWPLHGLTMAGLERLDDLQVCVESVVSEGVEGDLLEAGTWRGGSSILMRATLDCLGAADRLVWVADSFQGFPPLSEGHYADTVQHLLALFDYLAATVEEVRANFARFGCERGTRFVEGFFDETLPKLAGRAWSLLRLDADTYDATLLALRCLYPGLSEGGYLIVDDYWALDECRAAVDHFRSEHGVTEPLEQVDWTCVRWRREQPEPRGAAVSTGDLRAPASGRRPGRPARARARGTVPTLRELELVKQLEQLRERVAELESELSKGGG